MKPDVLVLLCLLLVGCVDSSNMATCANFTDVTHETVAERTATLSFKIVNKCAKDKVILVETSFQNPNGDQGRILCEFKLSEGTCDQTVTRPIGCLCDDQGTFRVTAVLKDDQLEVWVVTGYLSKTRFRVEHEVWADELTTLTTKTKEIQTTDSTSNTSDDFRTRMIIVLIIMVAVLFLILICTCILYCTA